MAQPQRRYFEPVAAPREAPIEIALRGGRTVRVGPGFDEATLARLVAVLEEATC